MYHSDWDIVAVERDCVFVVDLNLGNLSVTNDAEYVWVEIQRLYPHHRLIYRDSMGQWDEIYLSDSGYGILCRFKPYKGHLPEGY